MGDLPLSLWVSEEIEFKEELLYRFEIRGPNKDNQQSVTSLPFGDPFATETSLGSFSVVRKPQDFDWGLVEENFRTPSVKDLILYELHVGEFGGSFAAVEQQLDYLQSLGVNCLALMPVTGIAEPTRWGYLPIFYFAPEERWGDLWRLSHWSNLAMHVE